jgi:hypothetical protein
MFGIMSGPSTTIVDEGGLQSKSLGVIYAVLATPIGRSDTFVQILVLTTPYQDRPPTALNPCSERGTYTDISVYNIPHVNYNSQCSQNHVHPSYTTSPWTHAKEAEKATAHKTNHEPTPIFDPYEVNHPCPSWLHRAQRKPLSCKLPPLPQN